jgi:hypothetical protein
MLLLSAAAANAQRLTGALNVQVLDPSNQAIGEAQAFVRSLERGTNIEVTASAEGLIVVPDLPPGSYKVTVQHEGFKTTTAAVEIRVGITTSLELKLELGAQASTVIVEAATQTVDVSESTVQGVISSSQINSLPLNGRNFLDLAQQAPGVQIVDGGLFDPTKNQMVGVSVGGRSGRSTRIQVDGVDITDETVGTTVMNLTNESIEEFGVAQSSLDVSTDLTSSGAVNIITKSGSNDFHGTGFGFFRRSDFAANTAPLSQTNPAKPPFSRDNYGGSIAGPFLKNKWFWALDYEKLQQEGQNTTNVTAFPQFTGSFAVPVTEHMGGGRSDYNLTNNQKLFYRYTHDDNIGVTGFGNVGLSAFGNSNSANSHVAGWDYTKGQWVHSIRFSFLKFVNRIVDANALAGTPVTVDPAGDRAQINITGLGGFVYGPNANAPQDTFQQNRQLKYDASFNKGRHTFKFGAAYNRIDQSTFASFFGLGPRVTASFSAGVNSADPFNGNGAADPLNFKLNGIFFGNGLGFGSEKPSLGLPHGGFNNDRLAFYVHDNWKVSRTLTLNGGVRYDRDNGLSNHDLPRFPLIGAFDPELGATPRNDNMRIAPQAGFAWNVHGDGKTVIRGGGGIYYETNIFNNVLFDRTLNLVPGLGNATPNITGGLPVLLSPFDGSTVFDINNSCTGAQPSAANHNSCLGAALGNVLPFIVQAQAAYQQAAAQLSAHWPLPGVPVEFQSDLGTDLIGGSLIDPHYRSPYGAQINIGIQRQIRPGLVFSADYVMNRGTHFNMVRDRNRLGAANTLNVAVAQADIAATLTRCGAATIDQAIAACPNFKNGRGASIDDFADDGLGAGSGVDGFAFGGKDPHFRQMAVIEQVGLSRYQGLQAALTGRVGTFGPFRNFTTNVTYALSRFKSTSADQEFLSVAVNNDLPTSFYGPSNLDRLHQLGVSFITDLPFHFSLSSTTFWRSGQASDILLPINDGGPAEIFFSDLNGDGRSGDPLPGTNHGTFDRGVSAGQLAGLINNYNNTFARSLTPAGQALVGSGLFSPAQLAALGATAESVDPPQPGQLNNPGFYTTDLRLSWTWKFKERLEIRPMAEVFNIFNRTNWAGSGNNGGGNTALSGILSGGPGTINGTTQPFQRVGAGSGSFSSGTPRAFQFGVRVSF